MINSPQQKYFDKNAGQGWKTEYGGMVTRLHFDRMARATTGRVVLREGVERMLTLLSSSPPCSCTCKPTLFGAAPLESFVINLRERRS